MKKIKDHWAASQEFDITEKELLKIVHKEKEKFLKSYRGRIFPKYNAISENEWNSIIAIWCKRVAPYFGRYVYTALQLVNTMNSMEIAGSLSWSGVGLTGTTGKDIKNSYLENFVACCMHLMQVSGRGDADECYTHLEYTFTGGAGGFLFPVTYFVEKYTEEKNGNKIPRGQRPIKADISFRFEVDDTQQCYLE